MLAFACQSCVILFAHQQYDQKLCFVTFNVRIFACIDMVPCAMNYVGTVSA